MYAVFFFFNDTATTEIYTLSLHDALPIFHFRHAQVHQDQVRALPDGELHRLRPVAGVEHANPRVDRKSTRLNSSHANISYAVFCLKKKNKMNKLVNQSMQDRVLTSTYMQS